MDISTLIADCPHIHKLRPTAVYIKDSQSYHFSAQAAKRDISLPMAIVIAVSVHALLIFGVSFSMG